MFYFVEAANPGFKCVYHLVTKSSQSESVGNCPAANRMNQTGICSYLSVITHHKETLSAQHLLCDSVLVQLDFNIKAAHMRHISSGADSQNLYSLILNKRWRRCKTASWIKYVCIGIEVFSCESVLKWFPLYFLNHWTRYSNHQNAFVICHRFDSRSLSAFSGAHFISAIISLTDCLLQDWFRWSKLMFYG